MIIIDLFFFLVVLFFVLPLLLAALAWFKLRAHLTNPFQQEHSGKRDDGNVIEGQYEVVDESHKD